MRTTSYQPPKRRTKIRHWITIALIIIVVLAIALILSSLTSNQSSNPSDTEVTPTETSFNMRRCDQDQIANSTASLIESLSNDTPDTCGLDTSNKNLTQLSQALTIFPELQAIDASHNQISEIPTWIFQFDQLRLLNLSHNRITSLDGIILPPNLELLDITNNPIAMEQINTFRTNHPEVVILPLEESSQDSSSDDKPALPLSEEEFSFEGFPEFEVPVFGATPTPSPVPINTDAPPNPFIPEYNAPLGSGPFTPNVPLVPGDEITFPTN